MFFLTFVAIKIAVFLQISTGDVSDDSKMSFYAEVDLQFLQPVLGHGQCHQRFQNGRYGNPPCDLSFLRTFSLYSKHQSMLEAR